MNDVIPKGTYKGCGILYDMYTCKYFTWYNNKKHTSTNLDLLKKKIDTLTK